MGTAVFPVLPGLTFPVTRTPVFDTTIQQAISGKETRIARQSYPRWKWDLSFSILRSAAAYAEFQQLAGFFNKLLGMFDTFLYQDADDNTVTGQTIGVGDGTTTAFQLVRGFGGFVEPVLAPNVTTAVYLGGVSIPSVGITQPSAPTLANVSGGSLAGPVGYFVKIAYVNQGAGVTQTATESSTTAAANHLLTVKESTAAPAGAGGFYVYVGTTSGSETLQNPGSPVAIGGTWTEPTSGLISGSAPPTGNSTGWSISTWGNANPGVLTWSAAPAPSIAITADFSYYWPCRMSEDSMPFGLFMSQYYEAKKLSFISVKN